MTAYAFSVAFIEFSSLTLFVLALRQSFLRNPQHALEILFAFIYGFLLEELDIFFFRTYHYGEGFFLQLWNAPLAIAFLWSLITASSMAISDRLGIQEPVKPFLDALLAVLIDLSVDAIAIRIGYWHWQLPLTEGWFGVPAGNLYSWMWVVFAYSATTRIVRALAKRNPWRAIYQVLTPVVSYVFLFSMIVGVGILGRKLGMIDESDRQKIFWFHIVLFLFVVTTSFLAGRGRRGLPVPRILSWTRFAIHGYFILALLVTGMYRETPLLVPVAFSALLIECLIARATQPSES